ncbi:MAG: hypothetical protein EOO05_12420 [Chitinophagaceae bacterium]|nr:MAG: hypothetical protein EOO05_12420 [Chitinophagaceae bacterium]
MKLLLPLVALLMALTLAAQPDSRKRPAPRIKFFTRITELHLENPLYENIPGRGSFRGTADGRVLYTASSRKHKLDGVWMSWYSNQSVCDSGSFSKGLPHGEWKRWDENGRLLSVRHYDADRYQRVTQEMMHANPKAVLFPITRLYRRNPALALHYLHADYSFPGHDMARQESLEEHVIQNTSGTGVYHPVFRRSLHHGLFMNFDSAGSAIDSGFYKNGLQEGHWIHRFDGNGWEEGNYSSGKRTKEWKRYNASGRLLLLSIYNREGKLEWTRSFSQP